jgi:hypothetical protein
LGYSCHGYNSDCRQPDWSKDRIVQTGIGNSSFLGKTNATHPSPPNRMMSIAVSGLPLFSFVPQLPLNSMNSPAKTGEEPLKAH